MPWGGRKINVKELMLYIVGPWEGRTPRFHLILLDGWTTSLVLSTVRRTILSEPMRQPWEDLNLCILSKISSFLLSHRKPKSGQVGIRKEWWAWAWLCRPSSTFSALLDQLGSLGKRSIISQQKRGGTAVVSAHHHLSLCVLKCPSIPRRHHSSSTLQTSWNWPLEVRVVFTKSWAVQEGRRWAVTEHSSSAVFYQT